MPKDISNKIALDIEVSLILKFLEKRELNPIDQKLVMHEAIDILNFSAAQAARGKSVCFLCGELINEGENHKCS